MRFAAALLASMMLLAVPAYAENPMSDALQAESQGLRSMSSSRLAALFHAPKTKAPGIVYSRDWLAEQPKGTGGDQYKCLAQALYFEARGESVMGQFAVAEVILNRVDSPNFPDSVCGVVHQGTGRKYACQFTYTCDGLPETISEPLAYARASKIAAVMMKGAPRALTDGATYYHTLHVSPSWSRRFVHTATIGVHEFYKRPTQLTQN